jgi:rhodanese-related sulfurtransferase
MTKIGREELEELLIGGSVVVVEALPSTYFESGHLPGAKNLPLDQIEVLAPSLMPNKVADVVTYCAGPSCPNSKLAAQRLEALGYCNVRAYEGGKEDWVEAGLPLESEKAEVVR